MLVDLWGLCSLGGLDDELVRASTLSAVTADPIPGRWGIVTAHPADDPVVPEADELDGGEEVRDGPDCALLGFWVVVVRCRMGRVAQRNRDEREVQCGQPPENMQLRVRTKARGYGSTHNEHIVR